jgi:hypothetical protein
MHRIHVSGVSVLIVAFLTFSSAALASIVTGSSSTAFSTNVSYSELSIDRPVDAISGDVLIANVTFASGVSANITAPDGWTLIERTNKSDDVSIASYWKTTGGSESSEYVWRISPQARATGGITKFSGVDTSSPINTFSEASGKGTKATAASVTTTHADTQLLAVFSIDTGLTNSGKFSVPSGMTESYDISYAPFGPSTALAVSAQSMIGASGAKSSAFSKSMKHNWVAQLIALKPAEAILIPEPIAYWKFDETSGDATDSSGNGKTLTNQNNTPFAAGKIGNGADFERDSSHYFNRTNGGLNPTSGTASCWIKTQSNPSVLSIMGDGTGLGTGGFTFRVDDNNHLDMYFGDDSVEVNGETMLTFGTWYMASVTWSPEGKEVFLNGVSDGVDSIDQTLTAGTPDFFVGIRGDLNEGFDGIIDECGIWDTVLTNEQIQALYNSGNGLSYPF